MKDTGTRQILFKEATPDITFCKCLAISSAVGGIIWMMFLYVVLT